MVVESNLWVHIFFAGGSFKEGAVVTLAVVAAWPL